MLIIRITNYSMEAYVVIKGIKILQHYIRNGF